MLRSFKVARGAGTGGSVPVECCQICGNGRLETKLSLGYMPPERTDGPDQRADARADLYSLGATLYALFTGNAPFQAPTARELVDKIRLDAPRPLAGYNLDVPDTVPEILRRLLAKRPQDRYPSARELLKQLEGFAQAQNITV